LRARGKDNLVPLGRRKEKKKQQQLRRGEGGGKRERLEELHQGGARLKHTVLTEK